jgi:hypothetical protein
MEWMFEELIETLTKMLPIMGAEMFLVVFEVQKGMQAEVMAMGPCGHGLVQPD